MENKEMSKSFFLQICFQDLSNDTKLYEAGPISVCKVISNSQNLGILLVELNTYIFLLSSYLLINTPFWYLITQSYDKNDNDHSKCEFC